MGPIVSPETSVRDYHYTLRNIAEKRISQCRPPLETNQPPNCLVCEAFSSTFKWPGRKIKPGPYRVPFTIIPRSLPFHHIRRSNSITNPTEQALCSVSLCSVMPKGHLWRFSVWWRLVPHGLHCTVSPSALLYLRKPAFSLRIHKNRNVVGVNVQLIHRQNNDILRHETLQSTKHLDVCQTVLHCSNDISNEQVATNSVYWSFSISPTCFGRQIRTSSGALFDWIYSLWHNAPILLPTGRQQYRCIVTKAVYTNLMPIWLCIFLVNEE